METATVGAEAATGVGSQTIADLLPLAARRHGTQDAVRYKEPGGETWTSKTFAEVGEIVERLSLGLMALGIEKGDKVSILANTRPEWSYYDFAALSAGATVVPIYQTNSPEECRYVLENSDAKAVIVEDSEQLAKIREVRDACPKLEHVVLMTGSSEDTISTDELIERGAGLDASDWKARWSSVTPGRHLHVHLHLGNHRAPEGMRDLARQLPRDDRHGALAERARGGAGHLSVPAAGPLVRAPDPAAQLRGRRASSPTGSATR